MSSFKLSAVGDVWFGDHPVCIGHGVRSQQMQNGPGFVFEHVRDAIRGADISFCNLEGVISDVGLDKSSLESLEMRGAPQSAADLSDAGFSIVSVANNHVMQHGVAAFEDSLAQLDKNSVEIVGIDNESLAKVVFKEINGICIAFVAYSLRPEGYYDKTPPYSLRNGVDEVVAEISELRRSFDGFIVCALHWGHEFLDFPSPEQRESARILVDAGVDVLLGSHSHVWQGVERIDEAVVFYSLGNFLFDLWQDECRQSAIANLTMYDTGKIDLEIVPIWINEYHQPTIARGRKAEKMMGIFSSIDERLCRETLSQEDYIKLASKMEVRFRYSSYRYFLKNIYRYSPRMLKQSIVRTAGRKLSLLSPSGSR